MAAEVIRDVVIRVTVQSDKAKLDVPDMSAAKKAVQDTQRELEEAANKGAQAVVKQTDTLKNMELGFVGASNEAKDYGREIADANLKAGESLKAAGEGAFTLARGIAFIGASSEEDLQKAVQTIAAMQGAFDIFKGGLETIKGVTEGFRAFRAASTASAAANTALSVSNTAVATTSTSAAAGMTALNISTGGVLLVVGAAVAAVAGLALAFMNMGDDAEDAGDKGESALEKIREEAKKAKDAVDSLRLGLQTVRDEAIERELVTAVTPQQRLAIRERQRERALGRVTDTSRRAGVAGERAAGALELSAGQESFLGVRQRQGARGEALVPALRRALAASQILQESSVTAAKLATEEADAKTFAFNATRALRDEEVALAKSRVDEAVAARDAIERAVASVAKEENIISKLEAIEGGKPAGLRNSIDRRRLIEAQQGLRFTKLQQGVAAGELGTREAELQAAVEKGNRALDTLGAAIEMTQNEAERLTGIATTAELRATVLEGKVRAIEEAAQASQE
jgi:hypothetical protein